MAKAPNHRKLIVACVLAYFVFLMAMFPLNVAYQLLKPQQLPVKILAVSGTLWDGQVVFRHAMSGQVTTTWQLSPWSLLLGQVNAQIQAEGAAINARAAVTLNALNQQLTLSEVNSYIQPTLINKALSRNRVKIEGDVELSNASVIYNLADKTAIDAKGQLVWFGGNVEYPKGRKATRAQLPMLVASLSSEQSQLKAKLATTEGEALVNAYVKPDGWGGVSVLRRMIDLIGEPWPGKASADSAVFEVSEKLF